MRSGDQGSGDLASAPGHEPHCNTWLEAHGAFPEQGVLPKEGQCVLPVSPVGLSTLLRFAHLRTVRGLQCYKKGAMNTSA
jgi:hypothetical protein